MSVEPTIFFARVTKIEFMGVYQSLTSVMSVHQGTQSFSMMFLKSKFLSSGFCCDFVGFLWGFFPASPVRAQTWKGGSHILPTYRLIRGGSNLLL